MRLKLLSSSGQDILSSKTYFTKISVKGGLCNIHFVFSLILPAIAAKYCIKPNSCLYIVYLADFEEISILYHRMKKMVTSQTVYDTDPILLQILCGMLPVYYALLQLNHRAVPALLHRLQGAVQGAGGGYFQFQVQLRNLKEFVIKHWY